MPNTTHAEIPDEPGSVEGTLDALETVIAVEIQEIRKEKEARAQREARQKAEKARSDGARIAKITAMLLRTNTVLELALKNSPTLDTIVRAEWKENWQMVWSTNLGSALALWKEDSAEPPSAAICLSKHKRWAELETNQILAIDLFWRPASVGDIIHEVHLSCFPNLPETFDAQLQKLANPVELTKSIVRALYA